MSSFYGYQTDEDLILCDVMEIGNGTSTPIDKDTGNPALPGAAGKMAFVGESGGRAEIRVYAHHDLIVANGKSFRISLEAGAEDNHSAASAPFKSSTGWQDTAHFCLLSKDAADGALSFKAGDLLTAMIMPQDWLGDHPYLQLRIQTDADLSGVALDAFIHPVA